jgi:DNA ligase D-like protein (predicted 3'-phosphoesterase)
VPRFVVQEHDATAHHYDLRLEIGGVLRCWAVPKGPSLDPAQPRFATSTPDHELAAGDFEGVRRGGRRGSGAVIVWDRGEWHPPDDVDDPEAALAAALERGHASFVLHGAKLRGRFGLTRTSGGDRDRWLLVKARDDDATTDAALDDAWPRSVVSGRTLAEVIAADTSD